MGCCQAKQKAKIPPGKKSPVVDEAKKKAAEVNVEAPKESEEQETPYAPPVKQIKKVEPPKAVAVK